jgi:outer membrane protein TolC
VIVMTIRFRLLALALVAAAPLTAQQPITLEEAIGLAQQRGHLSAAARATRDAARYRNRAFGSRLLPQLSLSGDVPAYDRSISPVVQEDGSTAYRSQQRTNATLSMQLTQQLPVTGGNLFISSSLGRLAERRDTLSTQTWSSTPFSVGLRQDLFRPNTARWDRLEQRARSGLDERTYLEAEEDIALQTTDLFFNVYAARVTYNNAVTNAAVNDTLYRLNSGRFDVGRIGENDLLQSELALLRARTSVEGARLQYDRATSALRLALDIPVGVPLEVAVTPVVPEYVADTARAVSYALRNGATVSSVELQAVQARRRVTEAKLANGPGATIQATYGYNQVAASAAVAYQNLLEARQLTLSVQLPLWNWGAHGEEVRAAEADRDRVTTLAEAQLDQLAHDAHFAALQLAQARRNVALYAKADSVAGRRFEVAYNRYTISRITIDNLYLAQSEKDQAVGQVAEGLRAYWRAHYQLRRLTLFDFAAGQPIR